MTFADAAEDEDATSDVIAALLRTVAEFELAEDVNGGETITSDLPKLNIEDFGPS